MKLRPYQERAIGEARAVLYRGHRRVLIVAPTGAGKTVVASHIVESAVGRGRRVLFVAHRRELIFQAYRKLIGCTCSAGYEHDGERRDPSCRADGLAEADVGIIMATDARRRPTARVQVASIDTLRRRTPPAADLVIVDEAHRALARSYVDLAAQYPKATFVGLTATPYRADGKGLGDAFDELVVVASPRELIAEGYLVEPRVFTVPAADLPDLAGIKVRAGDYERGALADAVDREGLVGNIVEHWKRHGGGVRTVAFAASVEHSKHITACFVAAGVAAEHLDGETPQDERDAILRRLEMGETRVVVNCGVLCEGWDQPSVKCCILARPTKSAGLYLQQAGRILRPFGGLGAVILDHAGCVLEHGLPSDDRVFSLAGETRKPKEARAACKTCPECFAIVPSAQRVCDCGHAWTIADREELKEVEGDLVEVRPASLEERRAEWNRLCDVAAQRGYKPGWAAWKYKDTYGTWPPKTWGRAAVTVAKAPASLEDERAYLARLRGEARERGYHAGWIRIRFRARFGHDIPASMLVAEVA